MKPPYEITSQILSLVTTISEKIGEINANFLDKPSPQLRKLNKIKTIHSSLKIEGNTLTTEQITAVLENKRVVGPQKDIQEVRNAIEVYDNLENFKPSKEKSFLEAHKMLMKGLIKDPGTFRTQGVGIVKGSKVEHLAPPYEKVPFLMKDLFSYLESDEIVLIKSCVFHYEMEFTHPFLDGNGRMGRLWQTLILKEQYPIFENLPFETIISQEQNKYYKALSDSDKIGKSTPFIEFMLAVINSSLDELLVYNNRNFTSEERLQYFITQSKNEFSRKDYMNVFKDISSSTATRDLKKGIEKSLFLKKGEQNKTTYVLQQITKD